MHCLASLRRRRTALAALASALVALGCHSESAERSAAKSAVTAPSAAAPAGSNLASTPAAAEATPNDVALVNKIEAALAAETALHGSSIAVKAADGVVTLTGSTKDPELRSMAAQVALSVEGVRSVRNELTIATEA